MNNYSKPPEKEKAKTKPIKKPIGKQILETFIVADVKDVVSYGVFDVLLPGIKDAVWDLCDKSLHMLFYDNKPRSTTSGQKRLIDRTSYDQYYQNGAQRPATRPIKNLNPFDVIAFEREDKARLAYDSIVDHLSKYPDISVSTAYNLANIEDTDVSGRNYLWATYGWRNTVVDEMSILRLPRHEGYQLVMPEPVKLDQ